MTLNLRKLNGWQRLGVIISILWILIVIGIGSKEYFQFVFQFNPVFKDCWGDKPSISLFTSWEDPRPCNDPLNLLTNWKVSFRGGKFLAILFLPVFGSWALSYCLLWSVRWVKEGFRQNNK